MEQLFFLDAAHAVDKAISKRTKSQDKRNYLGGSQIGVECSRRSQYYVMLADEREAVQPRIQRIFDVGNTLEGYMADLLRNAGFDVRTAKPDGDQWGFSLADGRVQGHVDGVIMGYNGTIRKMEFPCLVEFKTAKASTFRKFLLDGLMVNNSVYYSQVQFYQHNMNLLNDALFIMMNKDTQDMYYELVPHNPAHAERLVDKAADILDAIDGETLMPRAYVDKNNIGCKFCDFRDRCWDIKSDFGGRASPPSWME